MAILVLNQAEVEELLDMEGCIEAMSGILESLARGELFQPLRTIAFPPGEKSVTVPWCASSPRVGLSGNRQIVLRA